MLAYSHPTCLQHDTGPDHPEQPARLQVVLDALRQAWPDQAWLEAPAARRGDLLRVHAPSLVDEVLATAIPASPSPVPVAPEGRDKPAA